MMNSLAKLWSFMERVRKNNLYISRYWYIFCTILTAHFVRCVMKHPITGFMFSIRYRYALSQGIVMNEVLTQGEVFSISTLIYARLRRVAGRVIDVMYMVENKNYAQHVVDLATATQDSELQRLAARLYSVMDLSVEPEVEQIEELIAEPIMEETYHSDVTEEEIYRAQVSHHYIGALR